MIQTVSDLIEELKKYPKSRKVRIHDGDLKNIQIEVISTNTSDFGRLPHEEKVVILK